MDKYNYQDQSLRQTVTPISDTSFLHTVMAGATLPLIRSLISGAIVAALAAVLVTKLLPSESDWWFYSLLSGLLTIAGTWWFFQAQHSRLVGLIEIMLQRDLDGSGVIGNREPAKPSKPEEVIINLRSRDNGSQQVARSRMHISPEDLTTLAIGLLREKKSLAEKDWVAAGIFGDREWERIRVELMGAGIIQLKNIKAPNLGYELTRAGLAVMEHYVPPTPPLNLPPGFKEL